MSSCTRHLSCRIVGHRGALTPAAEPRTTDGREWLAVASEVGDLGSIGVKATQAYDGRYMVMVSAFSGGACIGDAYTMMPTAEPNPDDISHMVLEVAQYAQRHAFGWRLALHG